jgi:hypothetical protein
MKPYLLYKKSHLKVKLVIGNVITRNVTHIKCIFIKSKVVISKDIIGIVMVSFRIQNLSLTHIGKQGHTHNTLFSLYITDRPSKVEWSSRASLSSLVYCNTLAY